MFESRLKKRRLHDHQRSSSAHRRTNGQSRHTSHNEVDTSKPTAIYKPTKGRSYTVSVAVADSVISNALTPDLKTALCGAISRALSVFCVDELVVFSDHTSSPGSRSHTATSYNTSHAADDEASGYTAFTRPSHFLYHIASYLETPPYLRRALFGFHPNLRSAGSLPSLDLPSHLRADEWCQYREGVTVDATHTEKQKSTVRESMYVNAGLQQLVLLDPQPEDDIPPNTRVTLRFQSQNKPSSHSNGHLELTAEAVAPETPREEGGYYWGYTSRVADGLTEVFTECPFEGGYDFSIGMSERGTPLRDLLRHVTNEEQQVEAETNGTATPPRNWQHLLIVFGGPPGLEKAVENDKTLQDKGVVDPKELFDVWINFMDGQGSRTIRTEEALWIGLMGCWEMVKARDVLEQ